MVRPPVNWFWRLRVSGAMVTAKASQVLSLTQCVGGSLKLAEEFSPDPQTVIVAGDADPNLETELLICGHCYAAGNLCLAQLVQERNRGTKPPNGGPEAA